MKKTIMCFLFLTLVSCASTSNLGYSEPSYSEPSYSEPSYSEPSYSEPSYSEPSYSTTIPTIKYIDSPFLKGKYLSKYFSSGLKMDFGAVGKNQQPLLGIKTESFFGDYKYFDYRCTYSEIYIYTTNGWEKFCRYTLSNDKKVLKVFLSDGSCIELKNLKAKISSTVKEAGAATLTVGTIIAGIIGITEEK